MLRGKIACLLYIYSQGRHSNGLCGARRGLLYTRSVQAVLIFPFPISHQAHFVCLISGDQVATVKVSADGSKPLVPWQQNTTQYNFALDVPEDVGSFVLQSATPDVYLYNDYWSLDQRPMRRYAWLRFCVCTARTMYQYLRVEYVCFPLSSRIE